MLWANSSNATLQAYLSKKYIRRVGISYGTPINTCPSVILSLLLIAVTRKTSLLRTVSQPLLASTIVQTETKEKLVKYEVFLLSVYIVYICLFMRGNFTQITPTDVPEFESSPIDKAKVVIQMKYIRVNIEWLLAIFEIYHQLSPL